VFGGEPGGATSTNATRIYDIATNTWSTGANMPVAVKQHSAVTGPDGRIFIFGGRTVNETLIGNVQIYNPATNTWASGTGMPIPKVQFGAATAPDGRIYIVGGKVNYTNSTGPFFHTVEIYNPATNSWANGPVIPAQVGELEAVSLSGSIYAIGGTDGTYRNYNFQLTPVPPAPTNLTATAVSSSQINLSWTDNSPNETGFAIERATASGGPYAVIATVAANTTSFANIGLTPSTTMFYRVRATNTGGSSPFTNVASATTSASSARLSVEHRPVQMTLSVRPNPMTERTLISFGIETDGRIQLGVYDARGNLVEKLFEGDAEGGREYQVEWKAGNHASGMYFSRLVTGKEVMHQKIVLRR
jgi:hypothetical protein